MGLEEKLPTGILLTSVEKLANWSRKSSLGAVTQRERPADRVAASVAAAVMAVERGSRVVRVHDVAATVDALRVWHAAQA